MQKIDERQADVCSLIATVAVLARQEIEGWITHGSVADRVQHAVIKFEERHYAVVRDSDRTVLVFTQDEWDAFKDGVDKGEFDMEMGLRSIVKDERSISDDLTS